MLLLSLESRFKFKLNATKFDTQQFSQRNVLIFHANLSVSTK